MLRHDSQGQKVEEILRRAIAIDATLGDSLHKTLQQTAAELGISSAALEQAEREWEQQQIEREEMHEFVQHQRSDWLQHLVSYLVVCGFLAFLDFRGDQHMSWSWWVIGGWGLGLIFHTLSVFNTKSTTFRQEFEAWRRKKRTGESDEEEDED